MERLTEKNRNNDNSAISKKSLISTYGLSKGPSAYCCAIVTKLADYEDLEEEGLLLKLPCKIGERVYEIYRITEDAAWEIDEHKIKLEDIEKIGKTVFLTRQEAEIVLKQYNLCFEIQKEIKNALKETYLDVANNYDISDLHSDKDKVACVASNFRNNVEERLKKDIYYCIESIKEE